MTVSVTKQKRNPSILLVEDSPVQALRFKAYLEEGGFYIRWEENGMDGLRAVNEEKFDLILLDVELPDITGFEVCRRLKADDLVAHIPVVMLTTRDRASDVVTGLENGAVDYIPKDIFAEAVLIETLKQMNL